MSNLFGVDFKSLFANAMGGQLYDATLTRVVAGSYNASDPSAGTSPTSTNYACKAVPTKIEHEFVDEDRVRRITGEVLVMLGTITTANVQPLPGDVIAMTHPGNGSTLSGRVSKVKVDPAGATATCKVTAS